MQPKPFAAALVAAFLFNAANASAHMPWLYVTEDGYARLYFAEGLSERDYHLPDAVAAAEVWQDGIDAPAKRLAMETLEEEDYIGLEGEDEIEPRGVVRTSVTYGVYNEMLLNYDVQHFPADNPESWPTEPATAEGIAATFSVAGDQLLAKVRSSGEPLAGAKATLSNEGGGEPVEAETDADGVASFPIAAVSDGLNGLLVMQMDPTAKGEIDGTPYKQSMRILTATFHYDSEAAAAVSALPPVPEALASFGAAVADGYLYVYGGHIGQAHDHSRDNLSKHFRRIALDGSTDWEALPMQAPLQGLPLVAHGGKLYRVGGLDARNATGEDEDLHSIDEFAEYDPATGEWQSLASLPGPRSSHNAVVMGNTLYVVGGWALSGSSKGDWQTGAVAYDFSDANAGWRVLAEPPFKRRALAVGHVDGRVVALCGMTDENGLSKQVFFYEPATDSWSSGPEFPGVPFHGFGLSAWNVGDVLYAGGMEGVLYRLSESRQEWSPVTKFATKRFFHQLVPDGSGNLLAVAGASPEVGRTASIERLDLSESDPPGTSDTASASSSADQRLARSTNHAANASTE